jgi:hypothetical protein
VWGRFGGRGSAALRTEDVDSNHLRVDGKGRSSIRSYVADAARPTNGRPENTPKSQLRPIITDVGRNNR